MSSGISFTIELDDKELESALQRAVEAAQDMRQPMGEIAKEWHDLVEARFDEQRDPLGVPWAKRRDNVDPERPVLKLTGDLRRAVQPDFGSDYARVGMVSGAGPGAYAVIHNDGGEIVPKHKKALSFGGRIVSKVVMPRRRFVGFGPKEQQTAEDVLGDYFRGAFGGAAT